MKSITSGKMSLAERLTCFAAKAYAGNQVPFLSSVIFGLLAYGFAMTNKLPNHDDVTNLFGKGATADSGRWSLELMEYLFPNFSMPWIYGLLTILLLGVSVCMIVSIFSIESRLLQCLVSGCFLVFPSIIGLLCYIFTSTSYALAVLLAVLAVWQMDQVFTRKSSGGGTVVSILSAMACMVFSIGIYQAYVTLAASLMVIILIRDLLDGRQILTTVGKGICLVIFLGASMAVYYLLTHMILQLRGMEFNSYAANANNFQIYELPERILLAYQNFARFFTERFQGLIASPASTFLHILLLAGTLTALAMAGLRTSAHQGQRWLTLAGCLVLTVLLPLAVTSIYLFVSWWTVHMIVLYSFTALYVLAAMLADRVRRLDREAPLWKLLQRGVLDVVSFCMAGILVINIYLANETYLNLHLRYENTYGFYSTLLSDLKQMPEFTEGRKVAIVGSYDMADFYDAQFSQGMQNSYMIGLIPSNVTTFMKYYLGVDLDFATENEIQGICQKEEYQQMPHYPYYGSLALIDEILVVKLN